MLYCRFQSGDIQAWAGKIKALPVEETFVFFKHEDAGKGPALAEALLKAFG